MICRFVLSAASMILIVSPDLSAPRTSICLASHSAIVFVYLARFESLPFTVDSRACFWLLEDVERECLRPGTACLESATGRTRSLLRARRKCWHECWIYGRRTSHRSQRISRACCRAEGVVAPADGIAHLRQSFVRPG